MDSIINRIKNGRLWDFPGGIHPPSRKTLSNQGSIESIPLAAQLHISIKQHIGVEGRICVIEGEKVLKGQPLTQSANPFAVPVHAPTSGTISKIALHPSAHPSALPEMAVHIQPDGLGQWTELKPLQDYQSLNKSKVVEAICKAGISGMGGAGFPTHIKVSPKKDVQFLIINGVECEPYITSDDRLMREYAWQIRQGIDVLNHLLSPKHIVIAVEDNKPEAIEAMKVACRDDSQYQVCAVPTKYPAGGEKQLIQTLTGKEVPVGGLPVDVGIVMQNVGTCFAIADAIFSGKPLIQRVVTISGENVQQAKNVWAPIGTPVAHLLAQCGYQPEPQQRLIMGGPMMGFALATDSIPVVKITNCILAPSTTEMPEAKPEQPCIRCSACADACPASLLPQQLLWYSKANDLDKAQEYNLFDCIECGACAYVCPSDIPLVHYYRTAKADVRTQQEEKDQADKARERFEARKTRLLRDQQEREEKHRKAAEARKQAMQSDGGSAKQKIAAALARAKAKKAATGDIAAESDNSSGSTQTDNKKQHVADAIARAKAKRASQQQEPPHPTTADDSAPSSPKSADETDDKKHKVAEAIARAKAKRAAQAAEKTMQQNPSPDEPAISTDDKQQQHSQKVEQGDDAEQLRKKRIAAAVARAKAKKQAQQQDDS
ncbi:electron transport complex subunit RsxC [Neptunicella sp. SCSIO 80796]|uniref:electron transport complex subunit RsxC n=1 Tax=Neptunicella plasticusilytica TaxID=3117012 RepID=UPI003A4DBF2F